MKTAEDLRWYFKHENVRQHSAVVTVQLDDLHPLSFHILAYKAKAFVFKVALQVRIDLYQNMKNYVITLKNKK